MEKVGVGAAVVSAAAAALCCARKVRAAGNRRTEAAPQPPRPDDGPPKVLELCCPRWSWLAGRYELSSASVTEGARGREHMGWNQQPVWVKPGAEAFCIYSGTSGHWKITDHLRSDMEQDVGYVKSASPHGGAMPHECQAWLVSDTQEGESGERTIHDPQVLVRRC
eukprot:TRINITY_DN17063_c0_g1_i1.p1 TRINITY_DN17063_c0_g1~~TRINITY_DN17063_c0_g1_i1.p1  ORF type:complete len:166 (+),score=41.00 TRINITY_DN17063_c0_g1_i1:50-547(+)